MSFKHTNYVNLLCDVQITRFCHKSYAAPDEKTATREAAGLGWDVIGYIRCPACIRHFKNMRKQNELP